MEETFPIFDFCSRVDGKVCYNFKVLALVLW